MPKSHRHGRRIGHSDHTPATASRERSRPQWKKLRVKVAGADHPSSIWPEYQVSKDLVAVTIHPGRCGGRTAFSVLSCRLAFLKGSAPVLPRLTLASYRRIKFDAAAALLPSRAIN
jgi:hypothetical protein